MHDVRQDDHVPPRGTLGGSGQGFAQDIQAREGQARTCRARRVIAALGPHLAGLLHHFRHVDDHRIHVGISPYELCGHGAGATRHVEHEALPTGAGIRQSIQSYPVGDETGFVPGHVVHGEEVGTYSGLIVVVGIVGVNGLRFGSGIVGRVGVVVSCGRERRAAPAHGFRQARPVCGQSLPVAE